MIAKLFVVLGFVFLVSATSTSIMQIEDQEPSALPEQQARIVGGTLTTIGTYPFAAPFLFRGRLVCGSSIISQTTSLSAASCFPGNLVPTGYEIRAGSTFYNSGGRLYSVVQFIIVPGFNPNTADNDLGLIKVSPTIQFSGTAVRVANLPPPNLNVPDESIVITIGWGYTRQFLAPSPSEELQSVALRATNIARCQLTNTINSVTGKLCARQLTARAAGPCNGDSGSALLYNNLLVGVTSFRNALVACGTPGFAYVFTKVSQYIPFIRANLN